MRYCRRCDREILPLMFKELLISFLAAFDLWYRPIHFLPLLFTTLVNFFLLLRAQRIVDFSHHLEFEVDGNVGTGTRRPDCIRNRVVIVRRHVTRLLFFPLGDNSIPKTRIPGVSAISLDGGEFSLLILTKPQVRFGRLGAWAAMVMKPRANPLARGMNDQ